MPIEVRTAPATDPVPRALLAAMEAELGELYGPLTVESTPSARPEELEAFVLVEEAGRVVSGGAVKRLDDRTGEIKRMYTVPEARGRGHARVLLDGLEQAARRLGFRRVRLDTGPKQPHARRLYLDSGYREIHQYNANDYASFFGEKLLPVRIPARFNGPPGSGHGGWSAAQAALLLDPGPAAVSLRMPPPLDVDLPATWEEGAAVVRHNGDVVLAARAQTPQIAPPEPVSVAAAAAVSPWPEWTLDHPFPTCFACGPGRPAGDGLHLFPGPLGDGRFAVVWTPEESSEELVWAALDCPSSAPVAHFEGERIPIVLAQLCLAIDVLPRVGEPHVIVAAPGSVDGRKRTSAVALFAPDGSLCARGEALWIELRR